MSEVRQMRVLHVITSLDTGGAEMMLIKLLAAMPSIICSKVVVIMNRGALSEKLESMGVEVEYLGIGQGQLPHPRAVLRMMSISRRFAPDVIQGWMYHGNLAALLIRRLACRRAKLFWNIRQTVYNLSREKRLTRWLIGLGARLSSVADRIVYNSEVSAQQHEEQGYEAGCRVVIPNGFDTQLFSPQPALRALVRAEFGLNADTPLIGQIARYHPMKGHRLFLEAAAVLAKQFPRVRFLLVGHGVTRDNPLLMEPLNALGIGDCVLLVGERSDIPRFMAAMDIVVSASEWGEGFPNVLGEAMASGVPCVATDVGDSADVIGDCGLIVAPGDSIALSAALGELLAMNVAQCSALRARARERICTRFSLDRVAAKYVDAYRQAAH